MLIIKKGVDFIKKIIILIRIYSKIIYSIRKGVPHKLSLIVTNKCNSYCKTCGLWENKITAQISFEDIKSAVISFPGRLAWISISGGEPFIHSEIGKILNFISSIDSSMLVSINSNGLEDKKIKEILLPVIERNRNKIFYLNLSLDGDEREHDFIRGVKGGFIKTKGLMDYFTVLSKKYPLLTIGVNSTISKYNLDSFYDFYMRMSDCIKHINVNVADSFSYYQNSPELAFKKIDEQKLKFLLCRIVKTLPGCSLELLIKRLYLRSIIKINNGTSCFIPCSSYIDNILLFYDETMRFCLKLDYQSISYKPYNFKKNYYECRNSVKRSKELKQCSDSCVLSCEKYSHIISSIVKLRIDVIAALFFK
ncbi:MAG: radical SAM protein [Candidatus Omnitrophota bacterium]